MYNSSESIKKFGGILFLISLVVTAIGAISVWILAAIIKDKNIWQPTLIGLGFAVAIGGLLISLALYFMFTALSEIVYFLSIISVNTNKQINESDTQSKNKNKTEEKVQDKSDENIEIYYDVNCPNCNALVTFAKSKVDINPEQTCPRCYHKLRISANK